MYEIVVGIILVVAGCIQAVSGLGDIAVLFVGSCVLVGMGLIWNGIWNRVWERNKTPNDRPT